MPNQDKSIATPTRTGGEAYASTGGQPGPASRSASVMGRSLWAAAGWGLAVLPLLGLALCGRLEAGRGAYAACWIASFAGLAWGARRISGVGRRGTAGILAAGLALRLLFVWAWPADSDVNRYIVEGSLQASGINPYRVAPGDPAVPGWLSETARQALGGVNHKELSAAYPPLAELYCRAVAAVSPTPFGFKAAAALADMAACCAMAGLLAGLRLPPGLLACYACNPLVLAMAAGEGHIDAAMVLCLALGLLTFARRLPGLAFFLLGAAGMVKYPALALPPFFLAGGNRSKALWGFAPLALFGFYAGAGAELFSSLAVFAGHVSHGGPLAAALRPVLHGAAPVVSLAVGGMLLAGIWLVVQDPWRGALAAAAVVLFCLPTVYPWYYLLLLPFWCLRPGWAWWWLLAAQGLATTPAWLRPPGLSGLGGEGWALAACWLPFGLLVVRSWRRPLFVTPPRRYAPVSRLTVVVPARNEAARLGCCLDGLAPALRTGDVAAVVVVDGGSDDATVAVARQRGARVLSATGGRGGQIAAGVAASGGDVVLVLHADAVCRPEAPARLVAALNACPEAAGGAMGMAFADPGPGLWTLAGLNALRARITGISFGDQGQFFRREALEAAGGFPEMALMEDVELALRLRGVGETLLLGGGLTVSGRRWHGSGFGGKVAGVLGLFAGYLAARRLGLADSTGRRYYRRYYGRPPHQTDV